MTKRALNPHRGDAAAFVEDAGDADHGVELQQFERDGGILQVDLAARDVTLQGARQGGKIHLEPRGERGGRRHAGADTTIRGAGNGEV